MSGGGPVGTRAYRATGIRVVAMIGVGALLGAGSYLAGWPQDDTIEVFGCLVAPAVIVVAAGLVAGLKVRPGLAFWSALLGWAAFYFVFYFVYVVHGWAIHPDPSAGPNATPQQQETDLDCAMCDNDDPGGRGLVALFVAMCGTTLTVIAAGLLALISLIAKVVAVVRHRRLRRVSISG